MNEAERDRLTSDLVPAARLEATPIEQIAVLGLVALWRLDPEAAFAIADANRLSAQLRRETDDTH